MLWESLIFKDVGDHLTNFACKGRTFAHSGGNHLTCCNFWLLMMVQTRLAPWLVKIFIWHNCCKYHDCLQCCSHLNLCCLLQHFLHYHQNICLQLFLNNNSFNQFNNIWFKKSFMGRIGGCITQIVFIRCPLVICTHNLGWILLSNKQDIRSWIGMKDDHNDVPQYE